MRISELSRRTGVPIPTIKFYLRDGLLPPGRRTAPNQADYDEEHLRRLRLVRVLVEIGGLSLVAVRRVLEALDDGAAPLHELLGRAHMGLDRTPEAADPGLQDARAVTDRWIDGLGWQLEPDSPARLDLAASYLALQRLGWPVGPEVFRRYADHAAALAEAEIEQVASARDRAAAVETTVVGTVIFERAFAALRRLAHEDRSRARFGTPTR